MAKEGVTPACNSPHTPLLHRWEQGLPGVTCVKCGCRILKEPICETSPPPRTMCSQSLPCRAGESATVGARPHWTPPAAEMAPGMWSLAGSLWLLAVLGGRLVPAAEEVLSGVEFVQRSLASEEGPGEYLFDWNGDEFFHVDLQRREAVWRLPQFGEFFRVQAEFVPGEMAILRSNLDNLMRRTNNTPAQNVPPKVTLYPEKPVELGEPNVLVCLANEFSPPEISLTWLKNGQEVKDRVEETAFYPSMDYSFHKFSYLTFIPNAEDVYYCRVEHLGLAQPLTKEWNADMAEPLPETEANVVCGLGLAVGIVGIIVGTVFLIKNRQMNEANFRRRPG